MKIKSKINKKENIKPSIKNTKKGLDKQIKKVIEKPNEKNRVKGLEKIKSRDLLKDLNKEFETARLRKLPKETRNESLTKIFNKCKGKFAKLCYKRSSAKIIQCVIKYGDEKMLNEFFSEIKSEILNIITKPFGKFVIQKLYEKNDLFKNEIINILRSNFKNIITDKIAIEFIDSLYNKLNNKNQLLEGLYLNEKQILYVDKEVPLDKIDIEIIANKLVAKELTSFEIAHDIIDLHLKIMDVKGLDNKIFLKSLNDTVPNLLFTQNGLKIAKLVLNNSAETENILTSLEPTFLKVAGNEYGCEFLLFAFNDTIKNIIINRWNELFINEHSTKLLLKISDSFDENMIQYIDENFTDFIRTYNYILVLEVMKTRDIFNKRSLNILEDKNENKILNDEFGKKFYLELNNQNIINIKEILGEEFDQIFN